MPRAVLKTKPKSRRATLKIKSAAPPPKTLPMASSLIDDATRAEYFSYIKAIGINGNVYSATSFSRWRNTKKLLNNKLQLVSDSLPGLSIRQIEETLCLDYRPRKPKPGAVLSRYDYHSSVHEFYDCVSRTAVDIPVQLIEDEAALVVWLRKHPHLLAVWQRRRPEAFQ